jgi:hypothetical protein
MEDDRPIYCLWAFDLRTHTPHLEDNEDNEDNEDKHPAHRITHRDMIDRIDHRECLVGYAYSSSDGWLTTTDDHARVKDPAVLDAVFQTLVSAYPRDVPETASNPGDATRAYVKMRQESGGAGASASFRDLYRESTEAGLLFVPVELADEVVASRRAIKSSATWGELRAALSSKRFAKLRDLVLAAGAEVVDDQPLEAPDDWPSLRYSEMPGWLPNEVVDTYGHQYDSMLGSGTNFDPDDDEAIEEMVEAAGVLVHPGGPNLEALFAS